MVSIEDALTYPMESEDWIRTVGIGGGLLFLSFLVVPGFIAYGYVVRVIRSRLNEEPVPPEFGDWGGLLVDGLKAAVIGFVYLLVPFVVGGVMVGGSMIAILTGTRAGSAAGLGGLLVGFLVTAVLSLVFGYVAVVAVVNFARTGDLGAGFDFGTIVDVGTDGSYAVAFLMAVVVNFAVNFVLSALNIIPILGTIVAVLLGVFAAFYVSMVSAYLWAGGYNEARGTTGAGRHGSEDAVV